MTVALMEKDRIYRKYRFFDMQVGETRFLPGLTQESRPSSSLDYAKKKLGGKALFVCKVIEGGMKVWRLE